MGNIPPSSARLEDSGAPGIDGISFEKIETWGRKRWLEGIMQELRSGAYRPQPLLRVWIPKSNGGLRPLGAGRG